MYTSQKDKETEERERKQKNVFPNNTKGETKAKVHPKQRLGERVCTNVPLVRARVFQPLDDGAVHLHTARSA
jgi:hypothetical protein